MFYFENTHSQIHTHTDTDRDRETDTKTDIEPSIDTDTDTNTDTDIDTDTDTDTDIHTHKHTPMKKVDNYEQKKILACLKCQFFVIFSPMYDTHFQKIDTHKQEKPFWSVDVNFFEMLLTTHSHSTTHSTQSTLIVTQTL